ncbi:DUF4317 domain-containing protein [Clostridium sp. PL3]|uniref:DUF4317 domain-containing protein n=1 Tax=Clostridium thailandense TaxID=2794346 RepID=A0A949X608_9CLOT|nr:DUF4317 domain-containing protein [Clostridium thailandense]MBV7276513.1 DUF4317 domain-containing protein [Clostridium thailandense]
MNKKDLADIRKEFKLGSYMMPIKEVYSVYLKKDNGEIITKELNYFEMMDIEKKELYLENFKKVLTGTIDTKVFELDFKMNVIDEVNQEEGTQSVLYNALTSGNNIVEYADKIVDKIAKHYSYETDVVINFVRAEYYKGNKKRSEEADEAIDDYVQAIEFVLCSVNKVDVPKKVLKFDYSEMTFKPTSALDITVNLNSPLDGFMFPSFSNDYVDVNKLIYYSSKAKQMNFTFVEDVLDCGVKPTAVEEKESFNAILNTVVGDKIKPETMHEIYEKINEKLEDAEEDDEEPTVDIKEVQSILEDSGIENPEVVKSAFEQVCGGDYDFKVKNIVPDFGSKSIKIENEATSIIINPNELSGIRQVIDKNGKKYIMIELRDDVEINGFKLETEEFELI